MPAAVAPSHHVVLIGNTESRDATLTFPALYPLPPSNTSEPTTKSGINTMPSLQSYQTDASQYDPGIADAYQQWYDRGFSDKQIWDLLEVNRVIICRQDEIVCLKEMERCAVKENIRLDPDKIEEIQLCYSRASTVDVDSDHRAVMMKIAESPEFSDYEYAAIAKLPTRWDLLLARLTKYLSQEVDIKNRQSQNLDTKNHQSQNLAVKRRGAKVEKYKSHDPKAPWSSARLQRKKVASGREGTRRSARLQERNKAVKPTQ